MAEFKMSAVTSPDVIVLLVDDNPGDILLVQEALEECTTKVQLNTTTDGEEALQLLQRAAFKPDLIILDLHLPRLNGLEVLERYKPKTAPVIIFSSHCSAPDAIQARELGADDCVAKPADLKQFVHAVCAMLERWTAPAGVA